MSDEVCNCKFYENLLNSEPNGKLQFWHGKASNGKSRLLEKLLEKQGKKIILVFLCRL